MNRRFIATAALVGVMLAACSDVESGTVTGKRVDPERNYTTTSQSCESYDKKHHCKRYVPVTTNHHDDQDWVLELRDGDDTGEVDVDQRTYDRYSVGDQYP